MLRAPFSPGQLTTMGLNVQTAGVIQVDFQNREQPYYRWTNTSPFQFSMVSDNGDLLEIIPPTSSGQGKLAGRVAKFVYLIFDPTKQTQTTAYTMNNAIGFWMESGKKPFEEPIGGPIT